VSRYINQAISVISFERVGDVRLKQAVAEKAFAKLFNAQSEQTNIPDEFDPSAARIVFSDTRKQMTISQVAVQLIFGFGRQSKLKVKEAIDIFEKNAWDLFRGFDRFLGKAAIRETAAIMSLNYPSDEDADEMHRHLYDRFVKISPYGDLASINLQLGFKTKDKFFLNLAAAVYELHAKEFLPPAVLPVPAVVNLSEIPIVERGYGLKIDINTRPQRQEENFEDMKDPKPLLTKIRKAIQDDADTFIGLQ